LTGSVPVSRAGMASGTADLQRDLGGAIMQSIFGALLTAGYAAAVATAIASSPDRARVTTSVEAELEKSFSSAANTASRYPTYAKAIANGAKESFVKGDQWAYTAGIVAIALGAILVFFMFPHKEREEDLLSEYHTLDSGAAVTEAV
jgi:DHA2 family multidrug resistance protein-like MFS transporter